MTGFFHFGRGDVLLALFALHPEVFLIKRTDLAGAGTIMMMF
jgi:hypothetical protein